MSEPSYEFADVPMDKRPGAVDTLRDQNERLHHQIELLTNQLAPVLKPEAPQNDGAIAGIVMAPLDEQVTALAAGVERLIRLRDRLVV